MTAMSDEELFQSLLGLQQDDRGEAPELLQKLGILIDLSTDLDRPDGAKHAIFLGESWLKSWTDEALIAVLHYFLANAWSCLQLKNQEGTKGVWHWEQPEVDQQLVCLRRAQSCQGFNKLPDVRKCQIATNTGNLLSHIGRFVEAINYWNRALRIDPGFSMAVGNRGQGLLQYAQVLQDGGHRQLFLRLAYRDFKASLEFGTDGYAREGAQEYCRRIEIAICKDCLENAPKLDGCSLGNTQEEVDYRRWALDNCLFVNPLNDLGPHTIAARDVLTVPSMRVKRGIGPIYHGFFNQIKQEFVTARLLCFEGANPSGSPHFADRDVVLHYTLDHPAYSISIEKTKIAFRLAYSIFDKMAFFINDYLSLGLPENRISFRNVWYEQLDRKRGLADHFRQRENWSWRGLYSVSKDLFEVAPGYQEAIEPDARDLNSLRNHAEHKYLKIHEWLPSDPVGRESWYLDKLAHSVSRDEFEAKTLQLLRLARASLVYLVTGIACEEERRYPNDMNEIVVPIELVEIRDEWKV